MMGHYLMVINMKCDHEYIKMLGEAIEGKYKYKCATCGAEVLLDHSPEAITNMPTPPGIEPPEEQTGASESYDSVDAEKKKKQSDYHKRRYQLMKSNQWTGSLKNEEKST